MNAAGCNDVRSGTHRARLPGSLLATLLSLGVDSSACPATLAVRPTLLAAPAGPALLPTDTRRLVVCGYAAGERTGRSPVTVEGSAARRFVTGFDDAPPVTGGCTQEWGTQVLVAAVTPTGVKRVLGDVGMCRSVTDGTRRVRNEPLVAELWGLVGG